MSPTVVAVIAPQPGCGWGSNHWVVVTLYFNLLYLCHLTSFPFWLGACEGEAWAGWAVGFPFFLPIFYRKGLAMSQIAIISRKSYLLFYLGRGMPPRFGFCFLLVIGFGFRSTCLWQVYQPEAGFGYFTNSKSL